MVQLDNLPEVARRDKNFLDTDESGETVMHFLKMCWFNRGQIQLSVELVTVSQIVQKF